MPSARNESAPIRMKSPFREGYATLVPTPSVPEEGLGFGILRLLEGGEFFSGVASSIACGVACGGASDHASCDDASSEGEERAFVLLDGSVRFSWEGGEAEAGRASLLDELPSTLHLPAGCGLRITALSGSAELVVFRVPNEVIFPAAFMAPFEVRIRQLSPAGLDGTADRTIRSILDESNASFSGMTIGEVVNLPGRWSSYPPHHHPQAELYHYRFFPPNGFGFSAQGECVAKVRDRDTVRIEPGLTHPQVAAPGHAMVYLWGIRHLEGMRFGDDSRIYVPD